MHIVMVLTSHGQLGATRKPTGVWLNEFTQPFYIFREAGADITLASPRGGQPPIDPASESDDADSEANRRFRSDKQALELFAHTSRLSEIVPDRYDALFFPGGHGPLWDLSQDNESKRLLQAFDADEKPIGAVCHGAAAFVYALGGRGRALVENRKLTAFTNEEETASGLADTVPFLLETALRERGALFQHGPRGQAFCVSDGNLVTGQNPASAGRTASALLQLLGLR
ncbi:type 1 glutamine amidotransferase domain-containing protein [Hydrocarboniclastica marina]|uniref:Type 1 glutamine amidotransferase domain-containing protein n=1 Tax=Hydrocarboniclastica marina TaxID=2259620 RepID=A0A4P7XDH6_9ALTE|nr:type 1 glutamine amidotransferase domain-containing protein [Hydrocarboniclastica marina]MAL97903.1 type 1 glutamine amidotransferase domain-containing protein [Alteromonadaceae bacterium]QCF24573.1 type 1 glutamine amidotransferase domain-containing protein [Hydrocarboniclastica marina]|tara:strand:+ start:4030 stop:4713 length:684 start_codon:yes stop_codon:yes gene_type:complete